MGVMNKAEMIHDASGTGASSIQSAYHGSNSVTLGSRLVGMVPWIMIAGLLYAGIFIHPKPTGSAVVPPVIERKDLLFGVNITDKHNIWIVGNFGKIIKSSDAGVSWKRQTTGVDVHLQDIDSWDDAHAVAIGNGASVLHTEDAGTTWKTVVVPHSDVANKLIHVHVGAGGTAWVVGEYGTVLRTTDFGATWKQMREPEDVNFADIDASNLKNIWIAAEGGKLFHSADEGATWSMIQTQATGSLMAIQFRTPEKGVAVGLDGTILTTQNSGATWTRIPDSKTKNAQHLFAITWDAQNNEWVAVGSKGVWVRMDADLTTFNTGKLSASDLAAHTKIGIIDQTHLVVAGERPGIWDRSQWTSLVGR